MDAVGDDVTSRSYLAASALIAIACSNPAGPGLDGTAHSLAELEERLETLRGNLKVPGLSVGISEGDRIVWTAGLGFADLEQHKPATQSTDFHIASLTKGFAGILIVKLVSEGKLSLDDPVTKYGVSIPNNTGIKVRHLANMTSEGTPGQSFSYNGDRFALLQKVIEAASGKSFAQLVVERIVQPAGLLRTAPNVYNDAFAASGLNRDAFLANFAVGYNASGSSFTRSGFPTEFSPAAGMISTVEDMLMYSIAIDSDRLLTASERSMLFEPAKSTTGTTLPYAIGWFSQNIRGTMIQWAYGYWVGNSSLIIRVPSMKRAFIALANSDGLSSRFPLGSGNLESSPIASEFLNAFVFGNAPLQ
ncbi:MAG TPA: serine hydrolase domain-containing protein [Gemmatimonadaceae bacterium]